MSSPLRSIEEMRANIDNHPKSIIEQTSQAVSNLDNFGRKLNAVAHVAKDDSIARAKNLYNSVLQGDGNRSSPLLGVPVAHKDLFMREGWPCECGSKTLAGHHASQTAFVIDRLDKQGAIDCGRLTLVEFGLGTTGHNTYSGTPTNPWHPKYICGGSSSGSGAVVASGIGPISLGSDTGGSVRLPAAACGLVGIKPTHGLVSRSGVIALSPTLDTVGTLPRSVRDGAVVLQAIAAKDKRDYGSILFNFPHLLDKLEEGMTSLRIGWPTNYFFEDTDRTVTDGIEKIFRLMGHLGAKCVDVDVPGIETANAMTMLITAVEGASLHEKTILENYSAFGEQTLARLLVGFFVPAYDYYNALANRAISAKQVLAETFEKVDAVITPVWPYPLPTIEESDLGTNPDAAHMILQSGHNTRPVNYLGFPAVNIPIGFDTNGLPASVQLIGAPFTEDKLLRIARTVERELNFWSVEPRLSVLTR